VKSLPVSRARIGEVFETVVGSGQPLRLTSYDASAVVVSEEQWLAIQETLYRLSAPGQRLTAPARRQGGAHVRD